MWKTGFPPEKQGEICQHPSVGESDAFPQAFLSNSRFTEFHSPRLCSPQETVEK